MNTNNYNIIKFPVQNSLLLQPSPSILGKRSIESLDHHDRVFLTPAVGSSVPGYLAKFGVTGDQFSVLQRFVKVAQNTNKSKPYNQFSRKIFEFISNDDQRVPLSHSITRRGNDVYIHLKTIGMGSVKIVKAIADWKTQTIFARVVFGNHAQLRDFENELKILKLTQELEGVVQLKRDSDIKNKQAFILDYYPQNLYSLIKSSNCIQLTDMLGLVIQAGVGIKNLHSKMIIHGDLKSENILINFDPSNPGEGKAVISDFNYSMAYDADGIKLLSGFRVGTLHCMAPEMEDVKKRTKLIEERMELFQQVYRASGVEKSDLVRTKVLMYFELGKKMDVYSFGKLLQECLYGIDLISPNLKIRFNRNGQRIEFPCSLLSGNNCPMEFNNIPGMQKLNDVINSALSDDPWSRPTMEEVLSILKECKSLIPSDLTASNQRLI